MRHTADPPHKLKILVFFSSENDIRTGQEQRAISDETSSAKANGLLEVEILTATKKDDVFAKITEFQPDILHFAGHGNTTGNLMFDGEAFSVENLASTFAGTRRRFRMLILAACNIGHHAPTFRPSCDFVVGCAGALESKAAVGFARGFYRELCRKITGWHVDETLRECVNAGHGEAVAEMGQMYREATALKLLLEPPRGKNLCAVKPDDHQGKCKVLFGETTQMTCAISGSMAEVGGLLRSLSSEMEIMQRVQEIRRLCIDLNGRTKQTAPPRSSPEQPDVTISDLDNQLSGLMNVVGRWSKIAGIVLPEAEGIGVSISGLKTALHCKLRDYRDGEGAVSEFCERLSNMKNLAGDYFRTDPQLPARANLWHRLGDEAGRLSSASSRLLDLTDRCLHLRFDGAFNAVKQFGKGSEVGAAVAAFIGHLPHHQEGDRPGATLWEHVEEGIVA